MAKTTVRTFTKSDGVLKSESVLWIEPEKLISIPGFNPRSQENYNLDSLVESIKIHGVIQPLTVFNYENLFAIQNGHRRHAAVMIAKQQGADIRAIPCYLLAKKLNDTERLVQALLANESEPLVPLDEAKAYQRLLNYSWSVEEIAHEIGRTTVYVYDRLRLIQEAGEELLQAIKENKVNISAALKIIKESKKSGTDQKHVLESHAKKPDKRSKEERARATLEAAEKARLQEAKEKNLSVGEYHVTSSATTEDNPLSAGEESTADNQTQIPLREQAQIPSHVENLHQAQTPSLLRDLHPKRESVNTPETSISESTSPNGTSSRKNQPLGKRTPNTLPADEEFDPADDFEAELARRGVSAEQYASPYARLKAHIVPLLSHPDYSLEDMILVIVRATSATLVQSALDAAIARDAAARAKSLVQPTVPVKVVNGPANSARQALADLAAQSASMVAQSASMAAQSAPNSSQSAAMAESAPDGSQEPQDATVS